MIHKNDRQLLKEILGSGHIKKITQYLRKKEIRRPDGKLYSASHISNVFNGSENINLESYILLAAEHYKKQADKAAAQRLKTVEKLKASAL
jgi:hypothetical protein